jgi:(p)ppGpp synthase/HD superfamily hydrolase
VADGVAALSKDDRLPKADRMADSLRRIREQPREVWMVKLADRITNLAPPPDDWSAAKRAAYRDEAIVIADALGAASPTLHARLRARIEAYAAHLDGGG